MTTNYIHDLLNRGRALLAGMWRHEAPLFVYAALGDSTAEGVGASHASRSYAALVHADLARYYQRIVYHNFGKAAARAHDVVTAQLERAIAAEPNLVTISIGANDVLGRVPLREFRADIRLLLRRLHEETTAVTVLTNIPDFSFAPRIPYAIKPAVRLRIKQYNAVIAKEAAALDATVVDTFTESAVIAKRFPEAVSQDKFHPSDLGYTLWANTMLTIIHTLLKQRRQRGLA